MGNSLAHQIPIGQEFLTRLLFSCLVDADWSDTANHERLAKNLHVEPQPVQFQPDHWLTNLLDSVNALKGGPLTEIRNQILEAALTAAQQEPGFFELMVPTGGGKTLSSMAFALAHAKAHGLRRIIYIVPYLTILEQNADAIRKSISLSLNDRALFEHHSFADIGFNASTRTGLEELKAGDSSRLAENWDAPIILTTNVMFLESLFSNQPRRCRKIHNIARSVVIMDECQNLPARLLAPTCAMLRQLVEIAGCSIVFSTATQPALGHKLLAKNAITNIRPITPLSLNLFNRLQRVTYSWPAKDAFLDWPFVANTMNAQHAALCVVNTTRAARELFEEIKRLNPAGCFHLSTHMCPAHRKAVLRLVRHQLQRGERCQLVSTQLIEAGVDVDFPLVLREMGPLESIIQAAGRCNREGKIPSGGGRMIVFQSQAAADYPNRYYPPDPWYKAGRAILYTYPNWPDPNNPATIQDYFHRYYAMGNLDEKKLQQARMNWDFRNVDERYSLIDNAGLPLVVKTWHRQAAKIERLIQDFQPTRAGFRSLMPYQVNLRFHPAAPPPGVCEEQPGLFLWNGIYDPETGLTDQVDDSHFIV